MKKVVLYLLLALLLMNCGSKPQTLSELNSEYVTINRDTPICGFEHDAEPCGEKVVDESPDYSTCDGHLYAKQRS